MAKKTKDNHRPQEIRKRVRQEVKEFQKILVEELTRLITTAFGLMAALAWRGVIQEFIDNYLKKVFGTASGLISEIIFALVVTILAVMVTWQLAKIKDRLIEEEKAEKKETSGTK